MTSSSSASGRASRRLRRDARGEDVRLVVEHGDLPAHVLDRRSRTSTPSSVCRPRLGSRWRASTARSVLLPEPLGPTTATRRPGGEVEVGGRELVAAVPSTRRRPRRAPRGAVEPRAAGSAATRARARRAPGRAGRRSRAALPWARASERIVSTSGASASPTATGTTTSSAATGPPTAAGSASSAAARVATAVARSRTAATRARPRLCRRTARRKVVVRVGRASRPAAASAPIAWSSAACRATRSLTRTTSARAARASRRGTGTRATRRASTTRRRRGAARRATRPTAGANHADEQRGDERPPRRSRAPAPSPAPVPR